MASADVKFYEGHATKWYSDITSGHKQFVFALLVAINNLCLHY